MRSDRIDAAEPKREDVGDSGVLPLAILAIVAVESRFEYRETVDAIDILDKRRERSAEMNIIVSCSEIGDGPGTGGSGLEGGSDRGGLGLGPGLGGTMTESGGPSGVSGVLGMCDGGTGKDESRRGRALRLSARRDSVVVVEDMAARDECCTNLSGI